MSKIEDKELDMLLQEALKSLESPTIALNNDLREKLHINADKKSMNVWYFPVFTSIIFTVFISVMLMMFISNFLIQIIVIGIMVLSIISTLLITYFGRKEFSLN